MVENTISNKNWILTNVNVSVKANKIWCMQNRCICECDKRYEIDEYL